MYARVALSLFVVAVSALLSGQRAAGSGLLVPRTPGPPLERGWTLARQTVRAAVRGDTAFVTVEQTFENRQPRTLEADYVFAFSPGAEARSSALIVSADGVSGRMLRGEDARDYTLSVLRRRKDTALIELLGRDLFVATGFSLEPGATRTLVFKYEQPVQSHAGEVELRIPLRGATVSVTPATRVRVEVDVELGSSRSRGSSRRGFDSRADTGSRVEIGPVCSPTHAIAIGRTHARHVAVRYEGALGSREPDLRMFWTTTRSAVGATLLTFWPKSAPRGYFLLVAKPSHFESARLETRPKDLTFVVDTSGSMGGDRLEQIRVALEGVIAGLGPLDRFNVLAYGNTVQRLWPGPRPSDADNRMRAVAFVTGLVAEGGSNVDAALTAALSAPRDADRSTALIFVSDGRATRGETSRTGILEHVREANAERPARIFTLGIGVDVDTVLLDRLALENGGLPVYVRPHEDAEVVLAALLLGLDQPVLARLSLELRGIDAADVLPANLPDLVRGETLFVTGRYGRAGRPEILLGERVGQVQQEYGTLLWAGERGDVSLGSFPARIWALRRIAQHVDALRLGTADAPSRVRDLVTLSTRFGLLTEYTAFLADERADHTVVAPNVARTAQTLADYRGHAVGALGFAQALNQEERRTRIRAPIRAQGGWLPNAGGRDVTHVTWAGVRQVADRTYFYRRGLGWVDAEIPHIASVSEDMARWTPRFFRLLEETTLQENAGLAQAGPVVLRVGDRTIRIVD